MSRDTNDIPEVFRRFLEEGGFEGGGDDDDRPPRPPFRPPLQPWWTNRSVWLTAVVLVILLSFNWVVTTYTEWLWFADINYQQVWLKQWGVQVISFVVAFVVAATILLINWRLAFRDAHRSSLMPGRQLLELPGLSWLINAGAIFLAYLFAATAATRWESFLLYVYRTPYGETDPIFNRDISFYLFELPVFRFLQGWFIPLVMMTLIGIVALHAAGSLPEIQRGRWQPGRLPGLRRHLAIMGAIFLALWSAGYLLDIYELNFSPRGVVVGASYTDLKATLPALRAQMILMALLALATLYNAFRFNLRPVAAAAALWLAAAVLLGGVYPAYVQRFEVEPNELAREAPYIDDNIRYTRLAFKLDKVDVRSFGPVTDLSPQDLADNDALVRNIRLWDYRPLQQTYAQLQELRPYYAFGEIDIDRYMINGELRQVMLAGRELNKNNLPGQSWVNQKLEFTHGYGVVMNPVNRVSPEGRPEFFIQDLPPQSIIDISVERPEIYFGKILDDVVFVGSGLEEFSYPQGSENVYKHYEGQGGVPLGSLLRRIAFAIRFGEVNVLLSEYITPETQVLYYRQIAERANHIAPFLLLDGDPYLVLVNGRQVWMIDGYTISRSFPYSTPAPDSNNYAPGGFNYIRNSVKITIDAYEGDVTFYLADPDDPIIQTYAAAFPDLFKPLDTMPASLQAHIRYPEDLFTIQTKQYLVYHMTNTQVFYNKEDRWEIPQEIFENSPQPIEPYYVVSSLPNETAVEYLLIQPYTPFGKQNMIAWIAARNDLPHYGELVVYELPKQELIFGPMQVEARIDQDTQISQQLSLWSQRGSRVIRGNLLVLPVNDSFLYVEPLYLLAEASGSSLPELKRVIVASGNRIAMRTNLTDALAALLADDAPTVDVIVTDVDVAAGDSPAPVDGDTPDPGATTIPPTPLDASVDELIRAANARFEAAQAAQRRGDWATYGRELDALQRDLQRLLELTTSTTAP